MAPGTRVKVVTDLTISGPLAQFGRGAIAEVSTQLLNQFVAQLEVMVLADTADTAAAVDTGAAVDTAAAVDTSAAVSTPVAPQPPLAVPVANPAPPATEVNLLRVAGWPILKRLVPVIIVVVVVIVLLVWWLG